MNSECDDISPQYVRDDMDLHTFLNHPDIQLPVHWNSHADFEEFVSQRFGAFLELIDQLEASAVRTKFSGAAIWFNNKKLA